jgi:hypothetical protein
VESRRLEAQLEERKRFPLEQRLREGIVGQDGAITTTAAGIHVYSTRRGRGEYMGIVKPPRKNPPNKGHPL